MTVITTFSANMALSEFQHNSAIAARQDSWKRHGSRRLLVGCICFLGA